MLSHGTLNPKPCSHEVPLRTPAGPRPNVYSHESAPGLLIATGNVGAHLNFDSGQPPPTPPSPWGHHSPPCWIAARLGCTSGLHIWERL